MSIVIGFLDLCAQISRISEVPEGIGTIAKYLCVHMLPQTEIKNTILSAWYWILQSFCSAVRFIPVAYLIPTGSTQHSRPIVTKAHHRAPGNFRIPSLLYHKKKRCILWVTLAWSKIWTWKYILQIEYLTSHIFILETQILLEILKSFSTGN